MPADFDEKSGLVWAVTDWGRWCQTVRGIIIQVNVQDPAESASHSPPIRSKEIKVDVSAKKVKCAVRDKVIFEGEPFGPILVDETIWTLEDKKIVEINLTKANVKKVDAWMSLFKDQFVPDPGTLHEMRKKIDLEMFQIENPGMDFSGAKMCKSHDAKYSKVTEKDLMNSNTPS